jgi:hypothetical protein
MRTQLNLASTFCANAYDVVGHEKRRCQAHADDNVAIIVIVGNLQTAHSSPAFGKLTLPARPSPLLHQFAEPALGAHPVVFASAWLRRRGQGP